MTKLYQETLTKLNIISTKRTTKERLWVQKYLGSNKPTKCTKTGDIIKLAKKIIKENNPSQKEFINLLDSLYKNATTFQEVDLAARLLGAAPNLKKQINPIKLDYWLNFTHGWAETDVLCQSNFTDEELLNNWTTWKKLLIKFSKDKNVHKRRASIVLLNKSVGRSKDIRLSKLAFDNLDRLKNETVILITKAVSWSLRALIKNHKREVTKYLKINQDILPKIAVREVTNKLLTGVKSKKIKQ